MLLGTHPDVADVAQFPERGVGDLPRILGARWLRRLEASLEAAHPLPVAHPIRTERPLRPASWRLRAAPCCLSL